MVQELRTETKIPYCPGCGHTVATNNMVKALGKLNIAPNDIILVSDIGCCGLVDPLLSCHTIHGLHGRAAALAMGVTLGLNNKTKKVIAVQGDGGATIGLQNLLEVARQNVNMTLIVQNNMVYGMTGGQISGLSQEEFKETILPELSSIPPFDICLLAHVAGASFVRRIIGRGDYSEALAEAFAHKGFSLVEIVGMCIPYGIDDIRELTKISAQELTLENDKSVFSVTPENKSSLFKSIKYIEKKYKSNLKGKMSVLIAGSAGEGVQLAADLLTQAGVASGLYATKKGEYPITVGTGFSVSEVILSDKEILFTGIDKPDVVIVVSEDGLRKISKNIGEDSLVIADHTLQMPIHNKLFTSEFRKAAGKKGAVLSAVSYWLKMSDVIPIDALRNAVSKHKHAKDLMTLTE